MPEVNATPARKIVAFRGAKGDYRLRNFLAGVTSCRPEGWHFARPPCRASGPACSDLPWFSVRRLRDGRDEGLAVRCGRVACPRRAGSLRWSWASSTREPSPETELN